MLLNYYYYYYNHTITCKYISKSIRIIVYQLCSFVQSFTYRGVLNSFLLKLIGICSPKYIQYYCQRMLSNIYNITTPFFTCLFTLQKTHDTIYSHLGTLKQKDIKLLHIKRAEILQCLSKRHPTSYIRA